MAKAMGRGRRGTRRKTRRTVDSVRQDHEPHGRGIIKVLVQMQVPETRDAQGIDENAPGMHETEGGVLLSRDRDTCVAK